MKNLSELNSIKEKTAGEINGYSTRVLIGMATCGIAAGAKPIYDVFDKAIKKNNLSDVSLTRVGCIGLCQYEPIVEIVSGGKSVTYINMDEAKAEEVAEKHLAEGQTVSEYTIENSNLA